MEKSSESVGVDELVHDRLSRDTLRDLPQTLQVTPATFFLGLKK